MGESDSPTAARPPRSGRSGLYLATIIGVVAMFYVAVAGANVRLNQFVYDGEYVRWMATTLHDGKNFAIYDPNINWRALRREQIRLLTETPDVVIFGGSRWQEAYANLLPGRKVLNAHVHSDYAEDFLALTQLLEDSDRLPATLILSLRYIIFEPIDARVPTGWREWMPEYRRMAARLGVEPHPLLDTLPVDKWATLFSAREVVDRIKLVSAQTERLGPTTDAVKETLDVIGSDGSLHWSRRNTARFTPAFAAADAGKRIKQNQDVRPAIDPSLILAVEKLIAHLRAKGVRVVFAQTPFHPAFYEAMEARPFGETLRQIEDVATRWEGMYGTTTVGSFDPRRTRCGADEFIDWHHAAPPCLGRVLAATMAGEESES